MIVMLRKDKRYIHTRRLVDCHFGAKEEFKSLS